MKFRIETSSERHPTRSWEPYEVDGITTLEQAREWAEETVSEFNRGLRPYESERVLHRVKLVHRVRGDYWKREHSWSKRNLVTKNGPQGTYDEFECFDCGATSRSYDFSQSFVLDRKYQRNPVWERCDTAQAHQEKRR